MTTLGTYPHPYIRIVCAKCPRMGRYSRQRLMALHGANLRLTDLRGRLTATCPLRDLSLLGPRYCGAYFLDHCKD